MGILGVLELSFGRNGNGALAMMAIYLNNLPIKLNVGKYLLVITARTLAATLQNHKIWRITGGLAIPIGGTLLLLASRQIKYFSLIN